MPYSFHYLIMSEHSMFQKELLMKLKGSGLTIGQPKVLDYLKDHNGASQKDIALGCHIEPGTLTTLLNRTANTTDTIPEPLLNRMEETGLVERRMLNGNRRSFYIFLTELGERKLELVSAAFKELEDEAFRGISDTDRKTFMDLFFRIYENTASEQ